MLLSAVVTFMFLITAFSLFNFYKKFVINKQIIFYFGFMKRNSTYLLLAIVFFIAFTLPNLFQPGQNWLFVIEEFIALFFLISGFFVFNKSIKKIVTKLHQRISWLEYPIRRLFTKGGIIILFAGIFTILLLVVGHVFFEVYGEPEYYQAIELAVQKEHERRGESFRIKEFSFFFYTPFITIMSFFMFASLFVVEESYEYSELRQQERLAKEQAEKEQALTKASALQKQLNPHFMFNTLNVLSGLMHEDLDKADKFIKKLSEIYRYVAIQSEEILAPLSKELEFAEAYIYLLKIRFENQLDISISIDDSKLTWLVPSLTLELLIENTIKHNRLNSKKPLLVEIIVTDENLIVRNEYRPRIDDIKSSKIGLKNLQERLSILGVSSGTFELQAKQYIATIPLINPNL